MRRPYDVREVIARVVDGSGFDDSRRVTARRSSPASRAGRVLVASCHNGVRSRSCVPETHFIELCNYRSIPLIFLQNVRASWWGGKRARRHREDGAKMGLPLHSVVPRFTVIPGGSFGAGNTR